MKIEVLQRGGARSAEFRIDRVYNLGSATRQPEAAKAHQDEVKHIGISIAFDVPAPRIYPLSPEVVVTGDQVTVQGTRTSGEVEIVLVMADELYVGVGSDHTDRTLERASIVWSKQACANVLAPRLWRWSEVADHWDDCRMRSWVDGRLYQDCGVTAFLRPENMLEVLRSRVDPMPEHNFAVFGGTIASVDKTMGFGSRWEIEMTDPTLDRQIRHAYRVVNLLEEIRPEFRVPVASREL